MGLPFVCPNGHSNMVDVEKLERRPLDKIYSEMGFTCKHCGAWKMLYATCSSLDGAIRRLNNLSPERKDFRYYFSKALRRIMNIQARMENNG